MRTLGTLLLFLLILASCTKIEQEGTEEINIYSLVINNSLERQIDTTRITVDNYPGFEWSNIQQIVLSPKSQYHHEKFNLLKSKLPELDRSTFLNFKRRNKESISLADVVKSSNIKTSIITDNELKKIFDNEELEDGWNNFYENYPGAQGILFVSRIGINKDKNQALIYLYNQFGSLGGLGYYLLLVKSGNKWKERSVVVTQMS